LVLERPLNLKNSPILAKKIFSLILERQIGINF
jgi:hypothetical protein